MSQTLFKPLSGSDDQWGAGLHQDLIDHIRNVVTHRLDHTGDIEAVITEVLYRLSRHPHAFTDESDRLAWVGVVADDLAASVVARCGTVPCEEGTNVASRRSDARAALEVLDALDTELADLLWAIDVEGRTVESLAETDGDVSTILRSVARARLAFRDEAAQRGLLLGAFSVAVLAPFMRALRATDRLRKVTRSYLLPGVLTIAVLAGAGAFINNYLQHSGPQQPTSVTTPDAPSPAPTPHRSVQGLGAPLLVSHLLNLGAAQDTVYKLFTHLAAPRCVTYLQTSACTGNLTPQGWEYNVRVLPDNPTGTSGVGASEDYMSCSALQVQPVTQCKQISSSPSPSPSPNAMP